MSFAVIHTPVGSIKIVEREGFITEIIETEEPLRLPEGRALKEACRQLDSYFSGNLKTLTFPVHREGTPFQLAVWNECAKIPYGEVRSYSQIAEWLGNIKAARAVGNALNKNRLLIAVPCHRVAGAKNTGGFRLGIKAKCFLTELEKTRSGLQKKDNR